MLNSFFNTAVCKTWPSLFTKSYFTFPFFSFLSLSFLFLSSPFFPFPFSSLLLLLPLLLPFPLPLLFPLPVSLPLPFLILFLPFHFFPFSSRNHWSRNREDKKLLTGTQRCTSTQLYATAVLKTIFYSFSGAFQWFPYTILQSERSWSHVCHLPKD